MPILIVSCALAGSAAAKPKAAAMAAPRQRRSIGRAATERMGLSIVNVLSFNVSAGRAPAIAMPRIANAVPSLPRCTNPLDGLAIIELPGKQARTPSSFLLRQLLVFWAGSLGSVGGRRETVGRRRIATAVAKPPELEVGWRLLH